MILKALRLFREFKTECVVACAFALQGCLVIYNTGTYGGAQTAANPEPLELYGVRWNSGTSKQEVYRINPVTGDLTKITDLTTAHNSNWNQIALMGSDATIYATQFGSASGSGSGSGSGVASGYGVGSGSFLSINGNSLVTNNFVLENIPHLIAVRNNGQVIGQGVNGLGTQTLWRIDTTAKTKTSIATHAHGNFNYQSAIDHGTDYAYYTGIGAGGGSGSIFLHKLNLQTNAHSSNYIAGTSFYIAGVKDASTLIIARWNGALQRMEIRELNVNTLSENYLGDLGDLAVVAGPVGKARLDANGWVVMIGRNASSVYKIYAFDINRAELRTVEVPVTTFSLTLVK